SNPWFESGLSAPGGVRGPWRGRPLLGCHVREDVDGFLEIIVPRQLLLPALAFLVFQRVRGRAVLAIQGGHRQGGVLLLQGLEALRLLAGRLLVLEEFRLLQAEVGPFALLLEL